MSSDGYYTEQVHGPMEYLDLGNFELASGFVLPEARLAYKTIGALNEQKGNAILLPHMYTGTSALIGQAAMYRDEVWRELGFTSRDGFIQGFVQGFSCPWTRTTSSARPHKWRSSDVSASTGGDTDAALGRITAATTLVAFTGDLFFPPEDIKADADRIPGAKFRETGTVWGHFTMFNLREQDTAAIDAIYADVLGQLTARPVR